MKPGCFRRERAENFRSRSSESIESSLGTCHPLTQVALTSLVDSDNHQRRIIVNFAIAESVHRSHDSITQVGGARL